MAGSIFDMVKSSAGALMGPAADRETTESTPAELTILEQTLERDEFALAHAEQEVRGLPRGHKIWKCPGCYLVLSGIEGGPEHAQFRMHGKRHPSHASHVERFTALRS